MKYFLTIFLTFFSFYGFAGQGEIRQSKQELVKELKILFKKNQTIYPLEIKEEKVSLFKLIEEVYAASAYQCLYGGWPSTTIKVGGKRYCHDGKSSDFYRHSYACKSSEFTCPPPLFGKDVCVPYKTRKERLGVYNACEKIEKTPTLSDDFKSDDYRLLVEYIKLAEDICSAPASDKKVVKVNCESIREKSKNFEELVKREQVYVKNQNSKKNDDKDNNKKIVKVDVTQDCENCQTKLVGIPSQEMVQQVENMSPRLIYDTLKKKYRESKLCNPIYNYPEEDAKGLALSSLDSISKSCSSWGKDAETLKRLCDREIERLKIILKPDKETIAEWENYQRRLYESKDDMEMYRLMLSAKKMVVASNDKEFIGSLAQKTFLENNVLIEEDGQITCPFPSYDAFEKAYTGYGKLKKKLKKPFLTIADYTMPSNQRRLFTFDMSKLEPMYNTWVAHGSGNSEDVAADSDGSNPTFSNEPGTNLSSDGFIIARQAAHGSMFGDNIILDGVDINNTKMRSRAIVLHGDLKTGGSYKALGFSQESFSHKMSLLKTVDVNSSDDVSIRTAANTPGYFYPTLGVSWGCLGVPDAEALNVRTGKYESQLQSLRRDLAGNTLIFSYSGENMRSKYF